MTKALSLGDLKHSAPSNIPIMLEVQPGRFALLDTVEVVHVQPDGDVYVSTPEHPSGLQFGAPVLVLRLTPNEANLPQLAPFYAYSREWTEHDRKHAGRGNSVPWMEAPGPENCDTVVRVTFGNYATQTAPAGHFLWDNTPAIPFRIVKLEWN